MLMVGTTCDDVMQLVILAAGSGTRLYPLSEFIPKSMMPVDGVPLIRRIYNRWKKEDETTIVCINEKQEKFFTYEFSRPGDSPIIFSKSESPLCTSGEIWNAKKYITGDFILYYGDMLCSVNREELLAEHDKYKDYDRYMGTMVAVKNLAGETGVIELDDNDLVRRFVEKRPTDRWSWAAIGVFKRELLDYCFKGRDFGAQVFPTLIEEGHMFKAYKTEAVWCDIGNIRSYELANDLVIDGKLC